MLTIAPKMNELYPGYKMGILILRNVQNPSEHQELNKAKKELETSLRANLHKFSKAELKARIPFSCYDAYYKRYKKTYPVLLQLESVVHKGKSLPNTAALVEAMFMAELKSMLLTAGHDLEKVRFPLTLQVAEGGESFNSISGAEKALSQNDIIMADAEEIIASVLEGPDFRTRITVDTKDVLFSVYAPLGVSEQLIWDHLRDIADNVAVISPESKVDTIDVIPI